VSAIRLTGSTSGYAEITPSAVAGDVQLLLPSTAGTLDRLNRAGNVLQVVNVAYSTQASSSSPTFADTGLTASITPTSASSKILVCVNQAGCGKDVSGAFLYLRLLRGSTTISNFERAATYIGAGATTNYVGSCSVCYLDSPATTSSTTYKTEFANSIGSGLVVVQAESGGIGSMSTITLMEIAA
jgi:hypothetical protein